MTSRAGKLPATDLISTVGEVSASRRVLKGIDDLLSNILGTTNQVIVTVVGDTIVLSTPQDIDANADVEFDSATLDDLTASRMVSANASKKIVSVSSLTSWIAGITNQITVTDNGDGTVTLSLPQNIDTDADVTFDTQTIDKIIFNLAAGLSASEGELIWNDDDKTLNLGLAGGVVKLQVGQELLAPRAKAIGSNIDNGQLVYVSGASGANPEMTLAKADAYSTSKSTIAMATEDVTQDAFGYYTAFGLVRDVDTSAYSEGDQLYLSAATAGEFTNVEPTRPNYSVRVGIVIKKHATEGSIFVNVREKDITHLQQDNAKLLFGTGSDASIYYDGTDLYLLVNEVAASDFKLNCGTNKTLELQHAVWDDMRTPANNVKLDSTKTPTEQPYKGGQVLAFASNANNKIYFNVQMPHEYKLGSDIEFHIHITLPTAGSGGGAENVKFDFTHSWAKTGDTFPAATTETATRDVQNDPADEHILMEIVSLIDGSSIDDVSSMIICSLERDVSVANDYTDDVYLIEVDFHYQINTMGSRQELAK